MSFLSPLLFLCILSVSYATGLLICPSGKYLSLQNDTCIDCPAGTFFPTTGALQVRSCQPCLQDTFSTRGAKRCTRCPPGQISAAGSSGCITCQPGTRLRAPFSPEPECIPCLNAYTGQRNERVCTLCPAGLFTPSRAITRDQCKRCPPGTQPDDFSGGCRHCFARRIQDGIRTTLCEECPLGSVRNEAGTRCLPCLPGDRGLRFNVRRGFAQVCLDCPEGTTNLGFGNDFCKKPEETCPPDRLTTSLGDCLSCSPDHFVVPGNPAKCRRCPVGQGSSGGLVNECLPCEEVVRREIKASTRNSRCMIDPIFDNSLTGPTFQGIRARDENGDCPIGTIVNSRFPYSCINCGQSQTTGGKNAKYCEPCPINTTNERDQVACVPCPRGFVRFGGPACVDLTTGCIPNTTLIRDQRIRETTVPFCESANP